MVDIKQLMKIFRQIFNAKINLNLIRTEECFESNILLRYICDHNNSNKITNNPFLHIENNNNYYHKSNKCNINFKKINTNLEKFCPLYLKHARFINKYPNFNFSSKLNRNDFLNFERNNIIKDNEFKTKKTKIKNFEKDFTNAEAKNFISANEQKSVSLFVCMLNAPLVISFVYFDLFSLNSEYFNLINRIALNTQLLNNFFCTGILISGVFRTFVSQSLIKTDILRLMEAKEKQENYLQLESLKNIFLCKILLCVSPGLVNFFVVHMLLNKSILSFNLLMTGGASITLSYFSLFLLMKIFKLEKTFGFLIIGAY